MRDNQWLAEQMYELWENHFVDVPRPNRVIIRFGKNSKNQLGCISWVRKETPLIKQLSMDQEDFDDKRISMITISRLFTNEEIPAEVVRATIAHEMCHYAHGFNSPLKQLFSHPHKGGIIRKEMNSRGLGELLKYSNKWLKTSWRNYLKSLKH